MHHFTVSIFKDAHILFSDIRLANASAGSSRKYGDLPLRKPFCAYTNFCFYMKILNYATVK